MFLPAADGGGPAFNHPKGRFRCEPWRQVLNPLLSNRQYTCCITERNFGSHHTFTGICQAPLDCACSSAPDTSAEQLKHFTYSTPEASVSKPTEAPAMDLGKNSTMEIDPLCQHTTCTRCKIFDVRFFYFGIPDLFESLDSCRSVFLFFFCVCVCVFV